MPRVCRPAVAALAAASAATAAVAALAWAGPARGGTVAVGAGPTVGPAQINAVGHPALCWQAGGNGSAVTLEPCDPNLQGQQWSLTGDGVLMNGNGYCLEARPGQPAGVPLNIDFAGQCAGDGAGAGPGGAGPGGAGQVWRYRAGQFVSTGICADAGGPVSPGTEIVRHPCPAAAARWSIGYSAVTVTAGTGSGPAGGMFRASVTAANAASAQSAYGVTITFSLPPGLAATRLQAAGGALWTCAVRAVTCTGTLPSGASSRIAITGLLPAAARPGDSYTLWAEASVTDTSQRPGTSGTSTSLAIAVRPAAPEPAALLGIRSPLPLIAAIAAALLLAGALLILLTRRPRRRP